MALLRSHRQHLNLLLKLRMNPRQYYINKTELFYYSPVLQLRCSFSRLLLYSHNHYFLDIPFSILIFSACSLLS
jgi:hypothetical protein